MKYFPGQCSPAGEGRAGILCSNSRGTHWTGCTTPRSVRRSQSEWSTPGGSRTSSAPLWPLLSHCNYLAVRVLSDTVHDIPVVEEIL